VRAVPRLLAITDPAGPLGPELEDWLRALAGAGVDGVQLRRKDLPDRRLLELARRARRALPPGPSAPALLVNGRLDVAVAADADGVHLPAAGLPTREVRRLARTLEARLGFEALIGRSTHHPDEVARARDEGADYVTFGPVWASPGKAAYGEPPGLAGLERAAAHGLPVLALGGVSAERLPEAARAGAAGAAGRRCFADPEGLPDLVEAARRAFPERPATAP
jgi:thiamine-phosphate pyrophosphorylase